ncbi:M42 family metallopeptidase [Candidatus Micrarchaeota archaeon]|nr:M42 family metallopeptidase [Candidatus Micrarchaeota archaeon]
MVEARDYLKKLSEMHAPSGMEDEVADFMQKEFEKHGFNTERDVLGNVIARKGKGKKVLVAAHMDEPAFAVSSVTKEGFLKFVKVGGLYDGILPTSRVAVHAKERITGVIGAKPPHLMKDEEEKKLIEFEQMFVDIGASSATETAKLGIRPGTFITFDSPYRELRNGLALGKAFDDRSGCAALLSLASRLKNFDGCEACLVGTIREETGLFGAAMAAFKLEPDFAISLDVTLAGGTPDVTEEKIPVKLGAGPALGVIEGGGRGLIMSNKLIQWAEKTAAAKKIPMQFEVSDRGRSDASSMQYSRAGVLAASIGIPSRYIHSPNEMVDLKDVENSTLLVEALLKEFPSFKP